MRPVSISYVVSLEVTRTFACPAAEADATGLIVNLPGSEGPAIVAKPIHFSEPSGQ